MKKNFMLVGLVLAAFVSASTASAAIVFGPGGIDGANGKTLAQTYTAFANAAKDHSGDVNGDHIDDLAQLNCAGTVLASGNFPAVEAEFLHNKTQAKADAGPAITAIAPGGDNMLAIWVGVGMYSSVQAVLADSGCLGCNHTPVEANYQEAQTAVFAAQVNSCLGISGGEGEGEGAGEGEGEGEGEGQTTCSLASGCPDLQAEGAALVQSLIALTLLPPTASWATLDLDQGGIPDRFEAAAVQELICGASAFGNGAVCTFNANLTTLQGEAGYALVSSNADVVAALLSADTELQTAIASLGFTGTYSVLATAKAGVDALSPNGDADGDGVTNLQEYNNVIAAGGGIPEYVQAVFNPLTDGSNLSSLPVAGLAGLGALFSVFGASSAMVIRRKKK